MRSFLRSFDGSYCKNCEVLGIVIKTLVRNHDRPIRGAPADKAALDVDLRDADTA